MKLLLSTGKIDLAHKPFGRISYLELATLRPDAETIATFKDLYARPPFTFRSPFAKREMLPLAGLRKEQDQ